MSNRRYPTAIRIVQVETGPLFDSVLLTGAAILTASAEVILGVAGYDTKQHPGFELFRDVNRRVAVARLWHIDPTNPEQAPPEGSAATVKDTP